MRFSFAFALVIFLSLIMLQKLDVRPKGSLPKRSLIAFVIVRHRPKATCPLFGGTAIDYC
jgi:hypothetical protein